MIRLSVYHDIDNLSGMDRRKPRRLSTYKKLNKDESISSQYNELDTVSNNSISARLVCLSIRSHPQWKLSDFYDDWSTL